MKTITFMCLSIAMLICLTATAGDGKVKINVKWGEEFQMPKKHVEESFVGNLQDGFLLISTQRRKSICLQKFDADLKARGEKVQSLESFP